MTEATQQQQLSKGSKGKASSSDPTVSVIKIPKVDEFSIHLTVT